MAPNNSNAAVQAAKVVVKLDPAVLTGEGFRGFSSKTPPEAVPEVIPDVAPGAPEVTPALDLKFDPELLAKVVPEVVAKSVPEVFEKSIPELFQRPNIAKLVKPPKTVAKDPSKALPEIPAISIITNTDGNFQSSALYVPTKVIGRPM